MASLERQYANCSAASKHRLPSNYFKTQKEPSDSLSQHVGKLKEIRASLANLGEPHSDEMFQVVLINSLPTEFGDVMRDWEMTHPDLKTTEFLLNFLQQREIDMKSKIQFGMTATRAQATQQGYKPLSEIKKVTKCKDCRQKGHWAGDKECSKSKSESSEVARPLKVSLNAGKIASWLKDRWVSDSGVTTHMCNNRAWFVTLNMYSEPLHAMVGNGTNIPILGVGTVEVIFIVNGQKIEGELTNVSYIRQLATNLLSIPAVTLHGMSTTFDDKGCKISFQGGVIATGKLIEGDLFLMNVEPKAHTALATCTKSELQVLGHPGKARLTSLLNDPDIKVKVINGEGKCAGCVAGKGCRASHPCRSSDSKATEAGERVHMDLVHLANKDNEYPYYLLCKDEWTEFSFVYP